MEKIEAKAPAKINVGLNIISKRSDGFHNLETIFYQINNLYDLLTFEKSNKYNLSIDGNSELEKDNIVTNAVKLLEKKCDKKINVKIKLNKNIPIGAGLGGGSSDGAITLLTLNKLLDIDLSYEELMSLALQLGSDVPLFLNNYPTIGKSRGEDLTKLNLKINKPILLVNPGIHISTKDAFSKIIPKQNTFDYSKLMNFSIKEWNRLIVNDFEDSVFEIYPEIREIKNKLETSGALFTLMSGTGSTVYGIFESSEIAKSVSKLFPESYFTFVGNK